MFFVLFHFLIDKKLRVRYDEITFLKEFGCLLANQMVFHHHFLKLKESVLLLMSKGEIILGYFTVLSATVQGLQTEFVRVEADVSNGLPVFHMVGYLSSEVKEAAERVRTAIRNMGYSIPAKRIVVNLSPACVKKRGTSYDLPVAVAVLAALQVIPAERLKETLFVGELGLNGVVQPVDGILSIVHEAKKRGIKYCVIPKKNEKEGRLIEEIQIVGVSHLKEVCGWIKGERTAKEQYSLGKNVHVPKESDIDYRDIQGQESVKRATLVAVAGNHNLLYIGPPGAGKTMMAKRIPTILPGMSLEESLEITKIYSAAGLIENNDPLIVTRPFREVHHSITRAALIGGGNIPRPGEVTLAHGGVLFLDELPELRREVLESLRQPLEEHFVRLVRNSGAYCFPADFMLVAAMNPCPCGYYPDRNRCNCAPYQVQNYIGKISRPLLDRIDICIEAPKVEYDSLIMKQKGSTSAQMREQVMLARAKQEERYDGRSIMTNAQMSKEDLEIFCQLNSGGKKLMRQAYEMLHLTARSYYKILKVARTIADLDEEDQISEIHISEAIGYRMIDEKYWGKE